MADDLKRKILNAYKDGSEINLMVECFDVSLQDIKSILIEYKKENKNRRTFTDEFKKLIAERDINGVSRRQISQELEINASTVKRACEQFGQALKEKSTSENYYTRIDSIYDMSECPRCHSKDINDVDLDTYYCMKCGNEFIFKGNHALQINWEYVE